MYIRLILLVCFLILSHVVSAQEGVVRSDSTDADTTALMEMMPTWDIPRGPLQDSRQLQRSKWYYSIDEAMREPAKVYKLSLEGKKMKTLPAEISRFPNIQMLNLSNNKLKTLPPEIGKLQNLEVLILANNKINTLPDEISQMENLTKLYLAKNRLVEVPAWIGGLSKLRFIDLTSNNLTNYEIGLIQYRLPKCKITH